MPARPPLPPFTHETAIAKVRAAENAWNTRNPASVALACTQDSRWRNGSEFLSGQAAIRNFLARKWAEELDYRLVKELWAFTGMALAVRFVCESRDREGRWWRSHGSGNWRLSPDGLLTERHASINALPIAETHRLFRWPLGARPKDHPGLTELGL
jgi:nuclear transport factor 2 (NTF2) superfamily protein